MDSSHEYDRPAMMGDVCWAIHNTTLDIDTIPGALNTPKEADSTVLMKTEHDINAHRRALRKLLRLLEQLPRELELLLQLTDEQKDKNAHMKQSVDLASENCSHHGNEASPPDEEEEEGMNESKPKSDTASFIIQQTQNSFPSQASKDHTMEDSNNGATGEDGTIPLELLEDLLLLLTELRLPENNDAIRDLVESCTEIISNVWVCYFSHMPLGDAVLPLLGCVLDSDSARASFAQINVLNAFFASAAASWDSEPCVIVIALIDFLQRSENPFDVHKLCAFLLERFVRCYDQRKDEDAWASWLECQCQQANTPVDIFISSVTNWAMHLTDQALDALDMVSDDCWVSGEIAVHVLVHAVRFNGVLDQSANRMWKTVASFGWEQAVNSNDNQHDDYLIAKLSVELAAVAMASIEKDSRTPTIAFFLALPFPELLMETTWWSQVPKADLQSGVLNLLQDQHNQQSKDLAKRILDHVPPLEDENIISWDMYFWHQVQAHGVELRTSAE